MSDNVKDSDAPTWENDPMASAYPETAEFWRAAEQGRLILKGCKSCGNTHWYPRAICPHCGGGDLEWADASGKGKIYAFSPARRASPVYTLAYVTLDEGPTIMTNIVDADPDTLEIEQDVEVTFLTADEGRMMPFFKPSTPS